MDDQINHDIICLSMKLKSEFPDCYLLLEETPLFVKTDHQSISTEDYKDYLQSIQLMLNQLKQIRPKGKK